MATTVLVSVGDCWPLALARGLRQRDAAPEPVTIVLLDRAADLARPSHPSHERVTEAIEAGAAVMVDTAALRRRGLHPTDAAPGITPTDLAGVGDLLVDATDKVIWL